MVSSLLNGSRFCARVWLVVAYSAIFEFPLTEEEVYRRIWRFVGETIPTEFEINDALKKLRMMGVINLKRRWWHLVNQPQAPANRAQWTKNSQRKVREAEPIIAFLNKLPWVVGVAITGSVAVNSAKKDDDVDFMIVTEPNRLWLTRLLTLLFAIKHGRRRSFAREEPNSWCLNLWLTTRALAVPADRHTLYTAYEVCQADWVVNKLETAQKFMFDNSWVKSHFPLYFEWRRSQLEKFARPRFSTMRRLVVRILYICKPLIDLSNWLAYILQLQYMRSHRTREQVSSNFAYFHPRDTQIELKNKLEQLVESLTR